MYPSFILFLYPTRFTKRKNQLLFLQIKESGSAVNLVSAATDDSEKVFQEAIEQVTNTNQ